VLRDQIMKAFHQTHQTTNFEALRSSYFIKEKQKHACTCELQP